MVRAAEGPAPSSRWLRRLAALLVAGGFGYGVVASGPPRQALAQAPPARSGAAAAEPAEAPLTQAELEQLLAPIALYPDSLLMQVLMAATYPLEVVQASRWRGQGEHAKLAGEPLAKALEAEPWDPSVKSLVPFADVLGMMNDRLDWTQALGDAVLAQQDDVFNAIQALRRRAREAGTLESGPQQVVTVTQNVTVPAAPAAPASGGGGGAPAPVVPPPAEIIAIAPADPQTVYVPVYDPAVAYGTWPYPSYPPASYPPPAGFGVGSALLTGLAFAGGVAAIGSLWGWARPAWGRGYVDVDVNRYNNINVNRTQITGNRWTHDASHRHGVAYRNEQTASRYRANDRQADRSASREQFRGRLEQARTPGDGLAGTRPGAGERPGLGDRPGAGDRPGLGDRPGAGDRPGLGDRPGASDRPGLGDRPGAGDRPGLGDRPGTGDRPSLADRAPGATRPTGGDNRRPQATPAAAQRPAIAANGRPQAAPARPATRPAPQGLQGLGRGDAERAAQQRGAASRASPVAAPRGGAAAAGPRRGGGQAASRAGAGAARGGGRGR